MILFLSDLQGQFEVVNAQIDHAEQRTGRAVDAVMLPGDLGLCEPQLSRFFRKRRHRFHRPFYYIEGNHEDFEVFDKNVERYSDVMTHLPRGTAKVIHGRKILALGGAAYMDACNTPEPSLVRPRDIERCLQHPSEAVDVVVTHDCPAGIGVGGSPMFRHLGPPGFPGSRELLAHFRPLVWIFGHHHRWFETTIDGTRFYGLPEAWRGYALLHEDHRVECVEHHLPQPVGILEKLRRQFRRRGSTG